MRTLAVDLAVWSFVVAVAAFVVAIAAAAFAYQQSKAEQGSNAPVVSATVNGKGNASEGPATLEVTFEGRNEIREAIITVTADSGLSLIGEPGADVAAVTEVVLRHVAHGSPISMPAVCSNLSTCRLRVRMKGPAFGNARSNVAVKNTTPWAY